MKRVVFLFAALYAALFPFAYFRHDDWLILGNAVFHLADSWDFAFKPTLFYGNWETPWFFRPGFKLLVLAFYKLFALSYGMWLGALLLMTVAVLLITSRLVTRLTGDERRGQLLCVTMAAALPLHFGSLLWAGEGMMNIPQMLLLAMSALLFVEGVSATSWVKQTAALILFLVSLGFKESSIFHPFFLAAMLIAEPTLAKFSWRNRIIVFVPYALALPLYLYVRLLKMPWNVHYVPEWSVINVVKPLAFCFAVPVILLAVWRLVQGGKSFFGDLLRGFSPRWLYLVCFLMSLTPYLGHGFFSTGWLLIPGFYFLIYFSTTVPLKDFTPARLYRWGSIVLVVFLIPVGIFLSRMGWWQWHKPQRELQRIVETASPDRVKEIVVFGCPNPDYPKSKFTRVVAFEASLYFLWALRQPTRVPVHIHPCDTDHAELRDKAIASGDKLVLKWKFPEITVLAGLADSRTAQSD